MTEAQPPEKVYPPEWDGTWNDLKRAPIYRGPEQPPSELASIIQTKLAALGVEQSDGGLYDLSPVSPEAIINTLDAITLEAGLLLHGSKSKDRLTELDPNWSNQQRLKSATVNATTDGETAAYYATLDIAKLRDLLPDPKASLNFGVGLTNYGTDHRPHRTFQVQADHLSYPVLMEHGRDPGLYQDGYIYILDRSQFNPSSVTPGQQRSDHEWSSEHLVKPVATLRIPASVGPTIITPDKLMQNEH